MSLRGGGGEYEDVNQQKCQLARLASVHTASISKVRQGYGFNESAFNRGIEFVRI